ncbi:unnamed protein product [Trichobilharzia szidati]|nr:unnamed protein product [Trichobilharzia szidati]
MSSSEDYSHMPFPPNWEPRLDPQSGNWFYINHEDKTTSWDDPRPAYYRDEEIRRLNTYVMGFGDRQDLIGEYFDVPEDFHKPHKQQHSKNNNPKSGDDRSIASKTQRGRSDTGRENSSSRIKSHSKRRTTPTNKRESRSSVCSQNDSESYPSSTCVSPVTHKNLKRLSNALKSDDDSHDHHGNDDDNDKPIEKVVNISPKQIDEELPRIDKLSLDNQLHSTVATSDTSNQCKEEKVKSSADKQSIPQNNAPLKSTNGEPINSLLSSKKLNRYQPCGPNPSLLGSRAIPRGPNPHLVRGHNASLVRGSIYQQQTVISCREV